MKILKFIKTKTTKKNIINLKKTKKLLGGAILNQNLNNDRVIRIFFENLLSNVDRTLIIDGNIKLKFFSDRQKEINVADKIIEFILMNKPTQLHLKNTKFNQDDWFKIFIKSLESITITDLCFSNFNCNIKDTKKIKEKLEKNKTLKSLDLSNINENIIDILTLGLIKNETLEILKLNSLTETEYNPKYLNNINSFLKNDKCHLKILDLSNNDNFDNDNLNIITEALQNNKSLEVLNLSNNTKIYSYDRLIQNIENGKNKTLKEVIISKDMEPLPLELLIILNKNKGRNKKSNQFYEKQSKHQYKYGVLFNPPLESLDITQETDQHIFKFIEKNLSFKSDLKTNLQNDLYNTGSIFNNSFNNSINIYKKHAIELCFDIEKFYYLLKHNYQKGIEGFNKLKLIKSFLTHTPPLETDTNIVILDLHGAINNKIFKLPDNINVVYLTPIKYDGISLISTQKDLLNFFKNIDILKKIFSNPSCYGKKTKGHFLNQSIIYYGGQYCIDLKLSREELNLNLNYIQQEHVTGLHILNSSNEFKQFNIEPLLPDLSKDYYNSTLSELLKYLEKPKYKGQQFTIFLTSCRELNDKDYNIGLHNLFSFYENIIKSINFKAQIPDNLDIQDNIEKYKTCKSTTKFLNKSYSLFTQVQKARNNNNNTIKSYHNTIINNDTQIESFTNNMSTSITIREIKEKILNQSENNENNIYKKYNFFKLYNYVNLNIFLELINNNTSKYFYQEIKNYNDIITFILNNNIDIVFSYYIYIFEEFQQIKKNILNSILNYFIKINQKVLKPELILIDQQLQSVNFLSDLSIDDKFNFKIKKLNLNYNAIGNSLSNQSNSLNFVKNLEEIYLNNNEITEFPMALLNLPNLKKIYLNDNKIRKFPNLIFRLPKLKILSLEGNPIKMKPKEISKFVKDTFTVNNNIWTRKISI